MEMCSSIVDNDVNVADVADSCTPLSNNNEDRVIGQFGVSGSMVRTHLNGNRNCSVVVEYGLSDNNEIEVCESMARTHSNDNCIVVDDYGSSEVEMCPSIFSSDVNGAGDVESYSSESSPYSNLDVQLHGLDRQSLPVIIESEALPHDVPTRTDYCGNCSSDRRHRVIADSNGVHATYQHGPDRWMIRSPLFFDEESFPRLAQPPLALNCTRDYAQILRRAVRRDRHGGNGRRDVYSYMPRSTLRSLAANGQLASFSLNRDDIIYISC